MPASPLAYFERFDQQAIPEGWVNLSKEMLSAITEHCNADLPGSAIEKEWYVSAIDVNPNGKLTMSGKHIFEFESILRTFASHAEHICCICGSSGAIHKVSEKAKLPLCDHHLAVALDTKEP